MRALPVLALAILAGCPGKHPAGPGGHTPAGVATYPALRWVPSTATYVVTARTATDLAAVLHDSANFAGMLLGFGADDVGRASQQDFGFDIESIDSLTSLGVDPAGGVAIYSTGLGPTAVARLAHPDRLEAFLDQQREQGVSVQSQIDHGTEVFTIHFDKEAGVSWAVVDGWVLAHVDLALEHGAELAWLHDAEGAGGGFAGDPDFAAALTSAHDHEPAIDAGGGPPVLAVVRPGPLLDLVDHLAPPEATPCLDTLRGAKRIVGAAGSSPTGLEGSIVIDVGDALASSALAAPGGWYAARDGAPVQLDVGLDLQSLAGVMHRCELDSGRLSQMGIRSAHLAAHSFDSSGLPSRAAAYADLTDDRSVRAMLSQLPGLSHFSKHRKVGDRDVVDVSYPMVPDFSYELTKDHGVAAVGDGLIDQVLGASASPAPKGELLHVDLRPHDVPDDAWDVVIENLFGSSGRRRAETLERLHAWDEARFDAVVDQGHLVVTVHGTRHH